jgi:hypothetical protein
MLANFLGKSKPINFIVLLVLFFCCFLATIYTRFFVDSFSFNQLLKSGAIFLLFIGVFFFFNFIFKKNRLTFDNSYAFYFFMLFSIIILPSLLAYKTLILFLIHLLFLRKIYSLKSHKRSIEKLFDSSLLLSIAFLIEPFSILFVVLLYWAIYYHQKITIQTLLTPIIGFLVPVFLYFTYCFWFDKTAIFLALFNFEIPDSTIFYSETVNIWFIRGILLISFLSIVFKSPRTLSVNNSFKRNWILLGIHFLIAVGLLFLIPEKNEGELLFLFFPASIIIANGMELIKKKWIKEILLYSLLISVIYFRFFL